MKRICAWCQRELGEVAPLDDPRVTHGICAECSARRLDDFAGHRDPARSCEKGNGGMTPDPAKTEDLAERLAREAAGDLALKYWSANAVPVERATIRAHEWENYQARVVVVLRQMQAEAARVARAICQHPHGMVRCEYGDAPERIAAAIEAL